MLYITISARSYSEHRYTDDACRFYLAFSIFCDPYFAFTEGRSREKAPCPPRQSRRLSLRMNRLAALAVRPCIFLRQEAFWTNDITLRTGFSIIMWCYNSQEEVPDSHYRANRPSRDQNVFGCFHWEPVSCSVMYYDTIKNLFRVNHSTAMASLPRVDR